MFTFRLRTLCSKHTVKKVKRQAMDEDKIHVIFISDQRLMYKIYKKLYNSVSKRQNPIEKKKGF